MHRRLAEWFAQYHSDRWSRDLNPGCLAAKPVLSPLAPVALRHHHHAAPVPRVWAEPLPALLTPLEVGEPGKRPLSLNTLAFQVANIYQGKRMPQELCKRVRDLLYSSRQP